MKAPLIELNASNTVGLLDLTRWLQGLPVASFRRLVNAFASYLVAVSKLDSVAAVWDGHDWDAATVALHYVWEGQEQLVAQRPPFTTRDIVESAAAAASLWPLLDAFPQSSQFIKAIKQVYADRTYWAPITDVASRTRSEDAVSLTRTFLALADISLNPPIHWQHATGTGIDRLAMEETCPALRFWRLLTLIRPQDLLTDQNGYLDFCIRLAQRCRWMSPDVVTRISCEINPYSPNNWLADEHTRAAREKLLRPDRFALPRFALYDGSLIKEFIWPWMLSYRGLGGVTGNGERSARSATWFCVNAMHDFMLTERRFAWAEYLNDPDFLQATEVHVNHYLKAWYGWNAVPFFSHSG
jgi:hypothetical protein